MDVFYPHPVLPDFLKDLFLLFIFSFVIITWPGVILTISYVTLYVTPVPCLSPLYHVSLSPSLAPHSISSGSWWKNPQGINYWSHLTPPNVQTLLMYHMAKEPFTGASILDHPAMWWQSLPGLCHIIIMWHQSYMIPSVCHCHRTQEKWHMYTWPLIDQTCQLVESCWWSDISVLVILCLCSLLTWFVVHTVDIMLPWGSSDLFQIVASVLVIIPTTVSWIKIAPTSSNCITLFFTLPPRHLYWVYSPFRSQSLHIISFDSVCVWVDL